MGMAGLYVGLSGIQTNSNSLNTTANNLSNVNTTGYVRQQVVNRDIGYNFVGTTSATTTGQKGLGVSIQTINHVRDVFLDTAYRKECGRQGFYNKLYDAVYEIQTQMGETDFITGIGFQKNITEFLESLHEVAKTPGDSTARSALVQSAAQFIDSAQTIYKGLVNYQNNLNEEIKEVVGRINEIGATLVEINRSIAKIEGGGKETASDLRDTRDLLLDELSTYCKISYNEDDTGAVSVSIEGVKFADKLGYMEMGLDVFTGTTLVRPTWPALNNENVYSYSEVISTGKNTDIGGLRGLLVARGNIVPTYLDAENVSSSTSTLVNVIANFDKLVSNMAMEINNIFCPETKITAADGTEYTVLDMENAPLTSDGQFGFELFTRSFCDRYNVQTIDGQEYYVRNDVNTFGNASTYTIMNLSVNEDIIQDYSRIPLTTQAGLDDYEKAEELVNLFSKKILKYNDRLESLNFEMFYESIVNDLANTGKVYQSMSDNEDILTHQLDSQRLEVMGVSSEEELSNMIKYQQAYNASSRFVNVIDSMLQTLIMQMGAG